MSEEIQRHKDGEGREIVSGYADEVSIKTIAQLEEWAEEKQRRRYVSSLPIKNYVNSYHASVASLNYTLDVAELGALMKLIPYIKMNAGGALHCGGERMGIAAIADALDKSVKQARRIVARLVCVGVLHAEKIGRANVYSVEEQYHSIGFAQKGAEFTKIMQMRTRQDVRLLSLQAAGVLYKMIPYFNYTHFYLTENPNEPDAAKLRYLSHRKFADMTNTERNTMNDALRELRRYGFVMLIDTYGTQLYRVNPDIMTRRRDNNAHDVEAIRMQFGAMADSAAQNGDNVALDAADELPF